ncbi:MAG: FHA domain-containing protein [Limisphaerales bacterium]
MAKLIYLSGISTGQEVALPLRKLILGRADDCDIVIEDSSVSGHHCELAVSEFGIRIRDLGSTNGTRVAAVVVTEAEVRDGQILMIGSVSFRLDFPPAHIAVPIQVIEEVPQPHVMADGTPACEAHRDTAAAYRCRQCEKMFCRDCVHRLGLSGGPARILCPRCSGVCVSVQQETPSAKATGIKGWLDTIRLKFQTPGKP